MHARTFIIATLLCTLPCVATAQTKLSTKAWLADLDEMVETIKTRHKNAYHTVSKEAFTKAVETLRARLPQLSDGERSVEFMRIAASVGDGHTGAYPDFKTLRGFPIALRSFEDGVFVVAALDRELIGPKVLSINGKPINDVRKALTPIIPADNQQTVAMEFDGWATIAEFLHGTGVIESVDEATFEFEERGTKSTKTLKSIPLSKLQRARWRSGAPIKEPRYREKRQLNQWVEWIEREKTLYVKFNRSRDMTSAAKLIRETAKFVEENEVERLVVDLRDNLGGKPIIFIPLFTYIKSNRTLNQRGKLFVIIGRKTFSAGVWAAVDMKQQTNAIFVGEPTSGKPNFFGDVKSKELPNTGITIRWAEDFHHPIKDADPESLRPDVSVPFKAYDFFYGRDPYLDAAIEYSEPKNK